MKDWLLRAISDKGRIPFKSVVNKTWGLLLNLWSSSINRRFPALTSNIRGLTFINFFSRSTSRRLLNGPVCNLILLLWVLPLVKDVLATLCSCRCCLSCHIIILIWCWIVSSYFWGCLFLQLLPRHQIWSQLLQTQIRRLRIKVLQSDGSVSHPGRVASSLRLRMILSLLAISERAQKVRL